MSIELKREVVETREATIYLTKEQRLSTGTISKKIPLSRALVLNNIVEVNASKTERLLSHITMYVESLQLNKQFDRRSYMPGKLNLAV